MASHAHADGVTRLEPAAATSRAAASVARSTRRCGSGSRCPQYDYSVPGESPLRSTRSSSTRARGRGARVRLALALRPPLPRRREVRRPVRPATACFEPIATLGALAGVVDRPRLGTLVLCEALRPPTVLAKALATLDRITGGRLDVGLGAGWYEPEYAAIGMAMPPPGGTAATAPRGDRTSSRVCSAAGRSTFDGRVLPPRPTARRPAGAAAAAPAGLRRRQGRPAPRDRRRACADGWNTCWVWTPDAYRERLDVLERACEARRPRPGDGVARSLGLYTLVGEDEARPRRAASSACGPRRPPACSTASTLDEWRVGRLVGTVEQVREQAADWAGARRRDPRSSGRARSRSRSRALDDVELRRPRRWSGSP